MALIKCPECGQSISDKAEICIHCGYPIKQQYVPTDTKEHKKNIDVIGDYTHEQRESIKNDKEDNTTETNNNESLDYQEKKKLLDYMKAAITLETDIATQEAIIQEYDKACMNKKPELELAQEPIKPNAPKLLEPTSNADGRGSYLLGFLFIACAIPLFVLKETTFSTILCIVGGIMVLMYFAKVGTDSSENNTRKEQYQKELTNYQNSLARVQKSNMETTQLYNANMNLWRNSYNENHSILRKKLSKTKALADELYIRDFIYPKYHNLPALTSIYEYLISGRCVGLTGPHGAYNLYEDEVRKDTVISQLNTVIQNLEQIKQNQYMLYQQAYMINKNVSAVRDELNTISGYTIALTELTALNTYYSALTASNTSISAAFHLLNG